MRTALIATLLTACGFGEATLEEIDPEAAPLRPTWSADVEPIIELYCTACHAEDAPVGQKEGFGYDDCQTTRRVKNWRGFEHTVFEKNNMPPGGAQRLTTRELLTMRRWADQGFTCD